MTDRWDWHGRPLHVGDWIIRKEFYADGPTMFVWAAYGTEGARYEFGRRKDAVAYARTHDCTCMTEDPGDGERVVMHSLRCPEHPEFDG